MWDGGGRYGPMIPLCEAGSSNIREGMESVGLHIHEGLIAVSGSSRRLRGLEDAGRGRARGGRGRARAAREDSQKKPRLPGA